MIRGTTGWKCIAAGTILGCVFLLQSVAHGQQTNDPQLRETVSDTLIGLSHSPPVSPGHPYIDICGETVKTWKDKPEVIPILMEFVTNGLSLRCDKQRHLVTPHTRQEQQAYYCAMNGIVMLGLLRAKPASGLLAEVAGRTDIVRFFQEAAIRAVIRIGDTNMLDFARDVCINVTKVHDMDRFYMYDQLINEYLIPETEMETKRDIIRLLMEAEVIEVSHANVSRLDPVICEYNAQWKRSYEREEVLKKFKGCETWLEEIKKLPADQRTHVEVRKLQVKEGPRAYHPNDPNAPKSSVSVTTNAPGVPSIQSKAE